MQRLSEELRHYRQALTALEETADVWADGCELDFDRFGEEVFDF
jgi:hypothetical protein